jgi:hypothetical protein
MTMKMLAAGGVAVAMDGQRRPDEDNPEGYYELEKVKQLHRDSDWVLAMGGRAIKVVSLLLYHLPVPMHYRIIFMNRDLSEIMASQKKMLERSGQRSSEKADLVLAEKFRTHLDKVKRWLQRQPNMEVLPVNYSNVVNHPRQFSQAMATFLGMPLDIDAMAAEVKPALYRNRSRNENMLNDANT